jgi:FixJ family two-component response regulator
VAETAAEVVYIIDPLHSERRRIMNLLANETVALEGYENAEQFLEQIPVTVSGCVVVPADLPGIGLRTLIDEISRRKLPLAIVVIGRDAEFETAVELVRSGIFDFLEYPFSDREIRAVVRRAIGADT